MLEAAIFDLDGLMFDTEPIWVSAWEPAFRQHGLELKPGLMQRFFGMSQHRIEELVDEEYGHDPRAVPAVREHVRIGIEEMLAHGAPKKPGLDNLLAFLAERDVPCAVASASPRAIVETHLLKGGVEKYFSAIIAGDDGLPSKPAPDVFLEAARRLHVTPARSLVLEDSPNGIRAASAGDFLSAMVPDMVAPTPEIRGLATCVCSSLLDVRDFVEAGKLG
ncbi:HAD family phosphatase [Olsenella sp. Marseille-P4559]|uniref:HAD family hydrolase n=1 Tax=Olsenella sp. Marseille-P4559 TaxID=2364795 RepID=UPI001031E0AA|nr:HAD family phosphatase [Olsenella sp. Marseille-P4559]